MADRRLRFRFALAGLVLVWGLAAAPVAGARSAVADQVQDVLQRALVVRACCASEFFDVS